MADEAKTDATEEPKKRLPFKTMLTIFALLVGEGVAVFLVAMNLGKPGEVQGQDLPGVVVNELDQLNEVLIVEDRFPNHQTGRVWLWETEVQVQVKQKHVDYVNRLLNERSAEIKTGLSKIWRTAQQRHLTEPNLETLNRQTAAYLDEIFGQDSEGEKRIQRVMIPKCLGFPADF